MRRRFIASLSPSRTAPRLTARAARAFAVCTLVAGALVAPALVVPAARAADRGPGSTLIGKPAPELVHQLFTGPSRNFRLSERRGDVVLIGFWTSWCSSCRAQLERLARLDATYASSGLVVVGVSLDDDFGRAAELARSVDLHFRNAFDAEKVLGRRFAVADVPLTLLVDRGGVVRYAHGEPSGPQDAALLAELRQLLDE